MGKSRLVGTDSLSPARRVHTTRHVPVLGIRCPREPERLQVQVRDCPVCTSDHPQGLALVVPVEAVPFVGARGSRLRLNPNGEKIYMLRFRTALQSGLKKGGRGLISPEQLSMQIERNLASQLDEE